jgi:hypothetical protein
MIFHSRCSLWLRSLLLVSCAGAAACSPAVTAVLAPEGRAGVHITHVTSYVPQEKLEVQYAEKVFFGSMYYELIAIDIVVNGLGRRESDAAARKVNEAVKDVDFRGQLWAAISPVAKESPWLKAEELKRSPTPFTLVTASRVSGAAALILSTGYSLSQGSQKLIASSAIRFYPQGQPETEAARNSILYVSDDIGVQEGEEAITLWIANDGAAYRKAVAESVRESAKMLRYALRVMGGDPPKPLREGLIKGGRKVSIIEETEERIILLDSDNGALSSLPARVVEVEGQTSLYAQKRASDAQKRALDEQNVASEKARYWEQYWKTWGAEHPGDPCVSALAVVKSAAECAGAACSAPLVVMGAYQKNCHPDPETLIDLNRLRRRWEKEAGASTSN